MHAYPPLNDKIKEGRWGVGRGVGVRRRRGRTWEVILSGGSTSEVAPAGNLQKSLGCLDTVLHHRTTPNNKS